MKKTIIKGFEQYIQKQKDEQFFNDQTLYRFDNNWGASIIFHQGSYGFERGLVELAVISWYDNDKYLISYDTEITHDVLGDLNEQQAKDILQKIKEIQ